MKFRSFLCTAALTVSFVAFGAMVSFAGEWVRDYDEDIASWFREEGKDYSWRYRNDDGSYAENTWIGNYYVGSYGYMVQEQMTPDGYLLGEDGSWYVATPANAREAYEKFRLYRYASQYDNTSMLTWYREDDFNGDGILDLLTMDFGGYEISQNLELSLYTIQGGAVRKADSYTGQIIKANTQPRAYFRWYEGKKGLFCMDDWSQEVTALLTIDGNLRFQEIYSEQNQIGMEQEAQIRDFWLWGERDFTDCEIMELSFDWVNCVPGGRCQGVENSSPVSYR